MNFFLKKKNKYRDLEINEITTIPPDIWECLKTVGEV